MPDKFTALTPELHRYIVEHGTRPDEVMVAIEEASEKTAVPQMQTAPDQAALITLLVRAIGARRAVEVGTFTGYGALAIARGLPEDGKLTCCELDEEYAEIARKHLERAGVLDRVEIRVGPALETLLALPDGEPLDFAYIDADKIGYPDYYERCLELLRPGGLIMLDNVLLGGRVLDPPEGDESAQTMVELNKRIAADERVEIAMLAVSDGITLALKK